MSVKALQESWETPSPSADAGSSSVLHDRDEGVNHLWP